MSLLGHGGELMEKIFQKTGNEFIERILPEIKRLSSTCKGVTA
jgi:hypothetical protein